MRIFSSEELKKYDGSNGTAYIAYRGKVYDVSHSFQWRKGVHQVVHKAGSDQTVALEKAPHGLELLDKFTVVGEIQEETL